MPSSGGSDLRAESMKDLPLPLRRGGVALQVLSRFKSGRPARGGGGGGRESMEEEERRRPPLCTWESVFLDARRDIATRPPYIVQIDGVRFHGR